jgi:hypothetical protein
MAGAVVAVAATAGVAVSAAAGTAVAVDVSVPQAVSSIALTVTSDKADVTRFNIINIRFLQWCLKLLIDRLGAG